MKYATSIIIIIIVIAGGWFVLKNHTSATPPTDGAQNQSMNEQTLEGGKLKIKITQEGTGAVAKAGDTVSVKYKGMLEDGTVFDATELHGGTPIEFKLGVGQVVKGWDLGIAGMKVGEKRTLTIASDLGYGDMGQGPIPPKATMIFDVELVAIK